MANFFVVFPPTNPINPCKLLCCLFFAFDQPPNSLRTTASRKQCTTLFWPMMTEIDDDGVMKTKVNNGKNGQQYGGGGQK
jgi:hypothetical protein